MEIVYDVILLKIEWYYKYKTEKKLNKIDRENSGNFFYKYCGYSGLRLISFHWRGGRDSSPYSVEQYSIFHNIVPHSINRNLPGMPKIYTICQNVGCDRANKGTLLCIRVLRGWSGLSGRHVVRADRWSRSVGRSPVRVILAFRESPVSVL